PPVAARTQVMERMRDSDNAMGAIGARTRHCAQWTMRRTACVRAGPRACPATRRTAANRQGQSHGRAARGTSVVRGCTPWPSLLAVQAIDEGHLVAQLGVLEQRRLHLLAGADDHQVLVDVQLLAGEGD